MPKTRSLKRPSVADLKEELKRENYKIKYNYLLRGTISALVVIAAAAVLAATLFFPVMRIFGNSMTPTLHEGEIVIAVKRNNFQSGDIIGFYYGNKLLVKRYIAGPGDWVNISEDGTVFVNEKKLEEPYVDEKSFGDCNIKLPYQIPDGRYFVLGDHRSTSTDSRNTTVGCIAEEQIVGTIVFCVWPLSDIRNIN